MACSIRMRYTIDYSTNCSAGKFDLGLHLYIAGNSRGWLQRAVRNHTCLDDALVIRAVCYHFDVV